VKAGKVKEIGCSNFSAAQLDEADRVVGRDAARFVSVQNEYSLLHRQPEQEGPRRCQRLGLSFCRTFRWRAGC
jgi:aryl-alcohol dehydrogenase-like predicted oxidoreductase